MNDIQPTPFGGEIVRLGDRATITGTLEEVGRILARIKATGQLVSWTPPVPHGTGEKVLVNVRLAPRVQAHAVRQAVPRRKLPRWAVWSIAGGVLALGAGIGWAIYAAVAAIVANLAVALVIAGAVVVLLVVLGKGGGKTFSGTFSGRID